MAPEKSETSASEWKWLEYLLYAAALAFVLIAVYQLVSTHRIVLLERESYAATATDADASSTVEATSTDDTGA